MALFNIGMKVHEVAFWELIDVVNNAAVGDDPVKFRLKDRQYVNALDVKEEVEEDTARIVCVTTKQTGVFKLRVIR